MDPLQRQRVWQVYLCGWWLMIMEQRGDNKQTETGWGWALRLPRVTGSDRPSRRHRVVVRGQRRENPVAFPSADACTPYYGVVLCCIPRRGRSINKFKLEIFTVRIFARRLVGGWTKVTASVVCIIVAEFRVVRFEVRDQGSRIGISANMDRWGV
jgi:hypothetical protein